MNGDTTIYNLYEWTKWASLRSLYNAPHSISRIQTFLESLSSGGLLLLNSYLFAYWRLHFLKSGRKMPLSHSQGALFQRSLVLNGHVTSGAHVYTFSQSRHTSFTNQCCEIGSPAKTNLPLVECRSLATRCVKSISIEGIEAAKSDERPAFDFGFCSIL